MTPLQIFWTCVLALSVLLFFAVEVVVVIGGAFDIAAMLRSLRRDKEERADSR